MNVLNNVNSDILSLVSAAGVKQGSKSPQGLDTEKKNYDVEFIKEKGLRNYLKQLEEEKIRALMEEAKRKALAKMGLTEEKLAELENKMPDKAYGELVSNLEKLTQDIFEDLLKKNMANYASENGEEALSGEALSQKESMLTKKTALFINHMA